MGLRTWYKVPRPRSNKRVVGVMSDGELIPSEMIQILEAQRFTTWKTLNLSSSMRYSIHPVPCQIIQDLMQILPHRKRNTTSLVLLRDVIPSFFPSHPLCHTPRTPLAPFHEILQYRAPQTSLSRNNPGFHLIVDPLRPVKQKTTRQFSNITRLGGC